jgi:glutathione S-transferase
MVGRSGAGGGRRGAFGAPPERGAGALVRRLLGTFFWGEKPMLATYPLTAIVLSLSLFVYIWTAMKVGTARAKYSVQAPAVDGPVEFQRVFRVHMNTLEQMIIFLPALALFAAAWGDVPTAIVAIFWPIGRVLYALRYYQAAEKRGPGFGISFLSSIVLLLGGLAGAVMQLMGPA